MMNTYCCLILIQQGLFSSPFWSVLIDVLCKVYFLLWNGWFRSRHFLSFLWITVLSDMLIQVTVLLDQNFLWLKYLEWFVVVEV